MQKIKVKFMDYWGGFEPKTHESYMVLQQKFDIELVDENPDVIVSGGFSHDHLEYDCIKIAYCTEIGLVNYKYFDLGFGSSLPITRKTHQINLSIGQVDKKCPKKDYFIQHNENTIEYDAYTNKKRTQTRNNFCVFMYANDTAQARKTFCQAMMDSYKTVDCLGSVMRNKEAIVPKYASGGDWFAEQLEINAQYKFSIAFENIYQKDGLSEKPFQALMSGCIPIYWGTPNVAKYINPKAMINVHDFSSIEECIEHVKKVDTDDALYQQYRNEPILLPDSRLYDLTIEKQAVWLEKQLNELLNGKRRKKGKMGIFRKKLYHNRNEKMIKERQNRMENPSLFLDEK